MRRRPVRSPTGVLQAAPKLEANQLVQGGKQFESNPKEPSGQPPSVPSPNMAEYSRATQGIVAGAARPCAGPTSVPYGVDPPNRAEALLRTAGRPGVSDPPSLASLLPLWQGHSPMVTATGAQPVPPPSYSPQCGHSGRRGHTNPASPRPPFHGRPPQWLCPNVNPLGTRVCVRRKPVFRGRDSQETHSLFGCGSQFARPAWSLCADSPAG
jgi:hypothetical protein